MPDYTKPEWDRWFDVQYDLQLEIDRKIEEVTRGKSDPFRAALVSAMIEHLAEGMRMFIHIPPKDGVLNTDLEESSSD